MFLHADSKASDQSHLLSAQVILFVLSCGGSIGFTIQCEPVVAAIMKWQ